MLIHKRSLPWTLNTNNNNNPPDRRGARTCSSYAVDAGTTANALQKMYSKSFSSKNADSYARAAVSVALSFPTYPLRVLLLFGCYRLGWLSGGCVI